MKHFNISYLYIYVGVTRSHEKISVYKVYISTIQIPTVGPFAFKLQRNHTRVHLEADSDSPFQVVFICLLVFFQGFDWQLSQQPKLTVLTWQMHQSSF